MYQKDYILRMVDMLMEMISLILGYIKKKEFKQATIALEYAYQTLLKEDASFFQNISIENLTENLMQQHHYTNGHLEILAELFFLEAELKFAEEKNDRSLELYKKSLILFEFIEKATKSYSVDKQNKMNTMKARISSIQEYLS